MTTPEARVQILKNENRRLERYLHSLPKEAWQHPSPCTEWTVADVIAHITGANLEYATSILAALQSDAANPATAPRRSNARVDASIGAQRAVQLRDELGDALFARYLESNRAVEASFDRVGPADWAKLCYRRVGSESIANVLNAFIVDVSVHCWDVMSPFDPEATLSPEGLPVMVERYPHRPRWWDLPLPAGHPPLPVRFRFEIPDVPAPGTDFVISAEGEQYMEVAGAAPAAVVFRCDAETFILVAYGRIKPAAAVTRGRLKYEGRPAWAQIFTQSFVGG
jgi:uncharacterized protein (TIGR03083 family)